MTHLIDTSTLSSYLGARAVENTPKLVDRVDRLIDGGLRASIVTVYEIERGLRKLEHLGGGRRKRTMFTMLCNAMIVYPTDGAVWEFAADMHVRAATHTPALTFGEADLLIAATARAHDLTLVTCDVPLFEHCRAIGFATVELVPLC